jgi:hypothetical protein
VKKPTNTTVWSTVTRTVSLQPQHYGDLTFGITLVEWRRMEKINWRNMRNEKVLLRVKEQRNILHEICKRKANWIGRILRRNCLLQRVTEGKIQGGIEVTGRKEEDVRSYWMTVKKGEDALI